MEFARTQLEKYGWKNGEGLGKNRNGISTAIKPKLKNNRGGLGHDVGEEFTYNWWEHSFNAAASRITVKIEEEGVKVKSKSSGTQRLSTKRPNILIDNGEDGKLTYGRFKKTTLLVGSGEERLAPEISETEANRETSTWEILSDEQLFLACGGRTAHKAARHGLKLNGKLARLEQQDKCVQSPVQTEAINVTNKKSLTKKLNDKKTKKKKHKL